MKPVLSVQNNEATKIKAIEAGLGIKNGKQIVGMGQVKNPGKLAVNLYILEDDSEIMEDEKGNAVKEWPEPVRAKKEEEVINVKLEN